MDTTQKPSYNNTKQSGNTGDRQRRPSRGKKDAGKRFEKSEYQEKMVDLRRVARVVKGGKRFSFRATLVLGNGNGKIGVGTGKGLDVAMAIDKARNQAKKVMSQINMKGTSVPHEIEAKYSAARVLIKPAPKGSGLKAGGAMRSVLLLAGIKDATAKCLGKTKNKLTNALATIKALKQLEKAQ